jgi:signal transduction histidine kinase
MVLSNPPAEASRHKCLVYDGDPSEQLPVIVPFLMGGLRENHRCLYLGDSRMIKMVESALAQKNVDVPRETQRKALLFSSDRSHLDNGFNPQAMIAMLRSLIDEAVQDGFQGLCATGDMRWELGEDGNFDKLLEYESLLEQVFREKPLHGICQYHRNTIPVKAMRDALLTHRSFYLGDALNKDNLFYMPPELHLGVPDESSRDKQGEWMCQQITRILKAERNRDEALSALIKSEAAQRRLAEELAKANQDLEHKVRERTADLEALNKELETFSYSVSHDLRSPLRSIDGFSQALLEDQADKIDDSGRDFLGRIRTATKRMEALIDGMLTLSRVTRQGISPEEVDLSDLARKVAAELKRLHPAHQVEFTVENQLLVRGDRTLLHSAMENLLSNAWKFTAHAEKARIQVGMRRESGERVFFIQDNGAGFDMAYAGKLFGVFQRMHTEAEFPGTGVGLSIVKRIINRHGGRLWAESAAGRGAAFYFTLAL